MPSTLSILLIVLLTLALLGIGFVVGYIIALGEKPTDDEAVDIEDDTPAIFDVTPRVARQIDDEESAIISAKTPKQLKQDKNRREQEALDKTVEHYK